MSAWEVAYGRCKTVLDANAAWLSAAWAIDAAEVSDGAFQFRSRVRRVELCFRGYRPGVQRVGCRV